MLFIYIWLNSHKNLWLGYYHYHNCVSKKMEADFCRPWIKIPDPLASNSKHFSLHDTQSFWFAAISVPQRSEYEVLSGSSRSNHFLCPGSTRWRCQEAGQSQGWSLEEWRKLKVRIWRVPVQSWQLDLGRGWADLGREGRERERRREVRGGGAEMEGKLEKQLRNTHT